jgi:hypothetical protein
MPQDEMLQTLDMDEDLGREGADEAPVGPRRGLAIRLMRLFLTLIGALIVVAGVLLAPLPGPMGLPVMVIGLMLVLRNSFWARRRFVRLQHAHPRWVFPLRRLLRKNPEIAAVAWQQALRVERLLIPRKLRRLVRMRRRMRRRR